MLPDRVACLGRGMQAFDEPEQAWADLSGVAGGEPALEIEHGEAPVGLVQSIGDVGSLGPQVLALGLEPLRQPADGRRSPSPLVGVEE